MGKGAFPFALGRNIKIENATYAHMYRSTGPWPIPTTYSEIHTGRRRLGQAPGTGYQHSPGSSGHSSYFVAFSRKNQQQIFLQFRWGVEARMMRLRLENAGGIQRGKWGRKAPQWVRKNDLQVDLR